MCGFPVFCHVENSSAPDKKVVLIAGWCSELMYMATNWLPLLGIVTFAQSKLSYVYALMGSFMCHIAFLRYSDYKADFTPLKIRQFHQI